MSFSGKDRLCGYPDIVTYNILLIIIKKNIFYIKNNNNCKQMKHVV